MNDYALLRVAAVVPKVKVADVEYNTSQIIPFIDKAEQENVSVLLFPELCVSAYSCADLFCDESLLRSSEEAVRRIKEYTCNKSVLVLLGVALAYGNSVYNCAVAIQNNEIKAIVPKTYLPNYSEFYEKRWFASSSTLMPGNQLISYAGCECYIGVNQLIRLGDVRIAVEICEDLWQAIPPSSYHTMAGAELVLNLSASNELLMKHQYRKDLLASHSAKTMSAYVYVSAGYGESTQDLLYSGAALIYENGALLAENNRFELEANMTIADIDVARLKHCRRQKNNMYTVTPAGLQTDYMSLYEEVKLSVVAETDFEAKLYRTIDPYPFLPSEGKLSSLEQELIHIQRNALIKRLEHLGTKKLIVGISGGLDSTLALLIASLAFDKLGWDRKGIIAVTMPGFGTSGRTYNNALALMQALEVDMREVSIVEAVKQHLKDIGHSLDNKDLTYENAQARERTQILMDMANKESAIVLGTGDLSEIALGWSTYNGDHMSMYAVNASVPKTLVKYLIMYLAKDWGNGKILDILEDIVNTPVSPELVPVDENGMISQKTEEILGSYELHDFFLYNCFKLGFSPKKIYFYARKAFSSELAKQRYTDEEILRVMKKFYWRFFTQQFKRSCMPDAPKVGSVALSPRGDWRMPSDISVNLWIKELESLSF